MLFQVEVGSKENEIPAAGRVLKHLDLRGKIITGDALLAQRELSFEIVQAGADYIWIIKVNQPETRQDSERLFAPKGGERLQSCLPRRFPTAQTTGKGHGRLEQRTLTASSALKGYLDWPGVEQVLKLERRFERLADGRVLHEMAYGVASLTALEAPPERLLELVRTH